MEKSIWLAWVKEKDMKLQHIIKGVIFFKHLLQLGTLSALSLF